MKHFGANSLLFLIIFMSSSSQAAAETTAQFALLRLQTVEDLSVALKACFEKTIDDGRHDAYIKTLSRLEEIKIKLIMNNPNLSPTAVKSVAIQSRNKHDALLKKIKDVDENPFFVAEFRTPSHPMLAYYCDGIETTTIDFLEKNRD